MLTNIDLKGGFVSYNTFEIDVTKPLEEQLWAIREDLMQIKYGTNYCVDVGFYPEGDPTGSFCIYVIQNEDWMTPLLKKNTGPKNFLKTLQECINFASQAQQGLLSLETLQLKGGKITFNELYIDLSVPLEQQLWELKEDLLRIKYRDDIYMVDVSFRPNFDPLGYFYVAVIKDFDWDNPLLVQHATADQLLSALQTCIDFVAEEQNK